MKDSLYYSPKTVDLNQNSGANIGQKQGSLSDTPILDKEPQFPSFYEESELDLLKELCLAPAISGDEKAVRDIIIRQVSILGIDYQVDNLGNLVVFKKGKNRPKIKLMLAAHMDEVGFIVSYIDAKGRLGFEKVGGIDDRILPGTNVFIGKDMVPGVIGVKPIHLTCKSDLLNKIASDKLLIDIGANDKEDALNHVKLGDSVTFESIFDTSFGKIRAKALDDRVGCFVLLNLIRSDLEYDMHFAFTTREEIGLIGASAAAYNCNPQASIVVEATTANDLLEVPESDKICKVGKGPAISFMDKRTIYDKNYYDLCFSIAKENNINVQPKAGVTGGNDAGAITVSHGGVRTIAISLPCRYLHSKSGLISQSDLSDTEKLLSLVSQKICSLEC